MSIARHHSEWLSLVEQSGPFLSIPVLMRVFPQGLEAHDSETFRLLRIAYDEWEENNQAGRRTNPAIHANWVRFILRTVLRLPDNCIAEGQAIPQPLQVNVAEHGGLLRPSFVIKNPDDGPNTRRRLSFFVMVLCHSRMMYVQFTLLETMEHFLDSHVNAFTYFGGVPARCMVDNLKSAVLQRAIGQAPVLNPRYKDFADHMGFAITPCGVGHPHLSAIT